MCISWFQKMKDTPVADGSIQLWWTGQSGFIIKGKSGMVCTDLFLSRYDKRVYPSIVDAAEINCADILFGTHDHRDHIDREAWPVVMNASKNAIAVMPDLLRDELLATMNIAPERMIGLNDGETVEINHIKLKGIASAHETLNPDPISGRYPCMGAMIEMDGFRIYQPGDTCLYEGLLGKLRRESPIDVMILPINGRDGFRYRHGIIGNLTFQEAADLAGIIKPRFVVPAHYDMIWGNTADPMDFIDYMNAKYPDQKYWLGKPGDCLQLTPHSRCSE